MIIIKIKNEYEAIRSSEMVYRLQKGKCILCGKIPANHYAEFHPSDEDERFSRGRKVGGKRVILYAICGRHGNPPKQETFILIEEILAKGINAALELVIEEEWYCLYCRVKNAAYADTCINCKSQRQ